MYDGKYPCLCNGQLHIFIGEKEIYTTGDYCFSSTGSVGFDENGDEYTKSGELVWSEEDKKNLEEFLEKQYSRQKDIILLLIEKELSNCNPCCGGCI
ncbi:MAG: hypothetical protein LIR50_14940 [Bacillota bacterium]|nr:hypothetical protein [Bacillota bacterium]